MNKRRNRTTMIILLFGSFLTSFCAEERPLLPNPTRQSILGDCSAIGIVTGSLSGFTAPVIIECIRTSADLSDVPSTVILATVGGIFGCIYGGYIGHAAGKKSLINTPLDMPPNAENAMREATKASLLKNAIISSTMTLAIKLLPQIF